MSVIVHDPCPDGPDDLSFDLRHQASVIGLHPEIPDVYLQVLVLDDGPGRRRHPFRNEDGLIQEVIQQGNLLGAYLSDYGLLHGTKIATFSDISKARAPARYFDIKSKEKDLLQLKDRPNYSARKLAEVIGITPKAIEKHLAKLKAEGLIKREGPDKGGSWTFL